jgi:hypothetical protein
MSISAALKALYDERDRLDGERARVDQAIAALEGIDAPAAMSGNSLLLKRLPKPEKRHEQHRTRRPAHLRGVA